MQQGLEGYQISEQGGGRQQDREREQFAQQGTAWGNSFRQPLMGIVDVGGGTVDVLIADLGDKPGASDVVACIALEGGSIKTVKAEHARVTAVPINGVYTPLTVLSQQARALRQATQQQQR